MPLDRLQVELEVRALRSQIGDRLRRGAPVLKALQQRISELEASTCLLDQAFLHERLRALFRDWQISLMLRINPWLVVNRPFFCRSAAIVAPSLLNKVIVAADGRAGRIVGVDVPDQGPAPSPAVGSLTDCAGRLAISGIEATRSASVICVAAGRRSSVVISAIDPIESIAWMRSMTDGTADAPGELEGDAVVRALGLGVNHQGSDLTDATGDVRIASDLRPSPLVLGQRGHSIGRNARLWRWRIPNK